jgi:uncharacterized protein (TIGR00251 family)
MIEIVAHAEGCILPVRAQPGAKKVGIMGEQNGALKVAVAAPPEQGKANRALRDALSQSLGIKRSAVELLSGTASRDKRFLIRGLTPPQLRERLAISSREL